MKQRNVLYIVIVLVLRLVLDDIFLRSDLVQAFNAVHAAGNFSYSNAVFFIL
jgi:hypothetical protein